MKKAILRVLLIGMILVSCLTLVACGASEGESSSSDSGVSQEASYVERLTGTASFSGLTFAVDPSWPEDTSDERFLEYLMEGDGAILAHTFLNGETKDLATYSDTASSVIAGADKYEIIREWSTRGVSFTAYSYSNGDSLYRIYLLGHADEGQGFSLFITRTPQGVETILNDDVIDAIFDSVTFSPDEVTVDSNIKPETDSSASSTSASETVSQKNAVKKAQSYLRAMAFSRQGLIEQLEYEGFSNEDATYGADNSGADWMAQAVKKAQSYLDAMAFSRQGLIEQLEYEGFTYEEAVHGVDATGL